MPGTDDLSEVERWRQAAVDAGLRDEILPGDFGVVLDDAETMLKRVKRADSQPAPRRRRFAPRRAHALGLTASLAATFAVVVTLVQPWASSPATADTPPVLDFEFATAQNIAFAPGRDAAETLRQLASVARTQDIPASGSVQHVVTDNWVATLDTNSLTSKAALVPRVSETWLSRDGSLTTSERRGTPLTPDGRGVPADGSWDSEPVESFDNAGPGTLDADFVTDLPRDVTGLRRALLASDSCVDANSHDERVSCLYNIIANAYRNYVIPPEVAANLWLVLADEGGFRDLGEVRDRAGRPGVGIALPRSASTRYRLVMIISQSTGQLIGTEEILVKTLPDLELRAPAITGFTAILESRRIRASALPERDDDR